MLEVTELLLFYLQASASRGASVSIIWLSICPWICSQWQSAITSCSAALDSSACGNRSGLGTVSVMFSGAGATEVLGTGAQGPNNHSRFPKKHMKSWPTFLECDFVTEQTWFSQELCLSLWTLTSSELWMQPSPLWTFMKLRVKLYHFSFIWREAVRMWQQFHINRLVITARPAFPPLFYL